MIDFKEIAAYLVAIVIALAIYIWKGFNSRINELEKNQEVLLSESVVDAKIAIAKNEINIELISLTNSLKNFVDRMEERHARFEKIEKKFEDFLDSRKDLHSHLNQIVASIGTKEEMLRTIDVLEKINLKLK